MGYTASLIAAAKREMELVREEPPDVAPPPPLDRTVGLLEDILTELKRMNDNLDSLRNYV